MIRKTANPVQFKKLAAHNYSSQSTQNSEQAPEDSFSFASRDDNAGWKIAGVCVGLLSINAAIATKNPAMALVGGGIGLALAFGHDG